MKVDNFLKEACPKDFQHIWCAYMELIENGTENAFGSCSRGLRTMTELLAKENMVVVDLILMVKERCEKAMVGNRNALVVVPQNAGSLIYCTQDRHSLLKSSSSPAPQTVLICLLWVSFVVFC